MRWSFVGEDREVMKVNIRKISEDTGFSMSTVSNALNRKKGVNKETAQKILNAAQKLGYRVEEGITTLGDGNV